MARLLVRGGGRRVRRAPAGLCRRRRALGAYRCARAAGARPGRGHRQAVRRPDRAGAEAALSKSAVSKSTVSTVCQAIRDELEAWSARRLDDIVLDYLFLDASMFKMHAGSRAEPVLAAWGITRDGTPVFVALEAGGAESTDAWTDFLDGLKKRGLGDPLLIISDGAAGLINAIETAFPRSLRQKCLIHRARNVLAKVPADAHHEVRDAYWAIFAVDELIAQGTQPGPKLVAAVQRRIDAFADQYARAFPSAVKCLLTDREQLPALPRRAPQAHPPLQLHRTHLRRDPPPRESDRPAARGDQLPVPRPGGARPRLPRPARVHHDTDRAAAAARPTPATVRPTHTAPKPRSTRHSAARFCRCRGLTSQPAKEPRRRPIYTANWTRPATAAVAHPVWLGPQP